MLEQTIVLLLRLLMCHSARLWHAEGRPPAAAGSAVAFGKLHGVLASKPLALPGKNLINLGLAAGNVAAAGVFMTTGSPAAGLAALGATTGLGGALGAHMTASIGGESRPLPAASAEGGTGDGMTLGRSAYTPANRRLLGRRGPGTQVTLGHPEPAVMTNALVTGLCGC